MLKNFAYHAALSGGLCSVLSAQAANGIYLTAYGAEATAMGGAEIAAVSDTGALIANPAGLANIANSRTDYSATAFSIARTGHKDGYSGRTRVSNELGSVVGAGHARRFNSESQFVWGAGVNVAGGLGYVYNNLDNVYGTVDDATSLFSLFRFSGGLAWSCSDKLRLGVVVAATYAGAEQSLFEDTSVATAEQTFFGVKVRDLSGWGGDVKLGMQYQVNEHVVVGANYTTEAKIDLDGGSMTVNYEAIGAGRVTYQDVSMEGLETPREFGIGVFWKPRADWGLSAEANWFDWAGSTRRLTLSASDPDRTAPADELEFSSSTKMHSQIVYSIGVEKHLGNNRTLRAGYSYHSLILDKASLSPTFALTPRHDLSVGYTSKLNRRWLINTALAYQPRTETRYHNPETPFGPSSEINESLALHFTFSQINQGSRPL